MDQLQAIVAYWLDCIKSEGALEQSFGITPSKFGLKAKTRAVLFEGAKDPFIFTLTNTEYSIEKGRTYELAAKATLKGQDVYFGYPLLMFFDPVAKENRVAPLFVMRLETDLHGDRLMVKRGESSPTLGYPDMTHGYLAEG